MGSGQEGTPDGAWSSRHLDFRVLDPGPLQNLEGTGSYWFQPHSLQSLATSVTGNHTGLEPLGATPPGPRGLEAEPAASHHRTALAVMARYLMTVLDTSSVFTAFHKDACSSPQRISKLSALLR